MPNIRANEKSLRHDKKKSIFNNGEKTKLRTLVKKVRAAVNANNKDEALQCLKVVSSELDTAAKKHIIHPNNAARRKSRLALMVNKMGAE